MKTRPVEKWDGAWRLVRAGEVMLEAMPLLLVRLFGKAARQWAFCRQPPVITDAIA